MADLSCLIDDSTIAHVDKTIEAAGAKKKPRRYLGFSEIGDICSRRLWIKLHTDYRPQLSGRVLRLFDTGHIIERRVVRNLKKSGYKVTGRQLRFKDFGGKFKGHCDGIVEGLRESSRPHILEVKSANDRWYKEFLKEGATSNPKYSTQSHLYMAYAGVDRCLFVVENKNDSARFQERVRLDMKIVDMAKAKAKAIIESKSPPSGISDREDWYQCKMCPLNNAEWCRRDWDCKDGVPF